ncbi:MAG: hypothetical protein WD492_06665 [Alkalispirochaeta sp.]
MKKVDTLPIVTSLIVSLAIVVLWGCATPVETPPEWISGSDILTERQLVAYGRGDTQEEALQRARRDVTSQISQILVRDLEAQEIAVTGAVGQAVEARAADRLETQEPVESFRRRDAQGVVEQYLLYEYLPDDRNRDLTELYEAAGIGVSAARDSEPSDSRTDSDRDESEIRSPLGEVHALLSGPIPETSTERRRRLEETRQLADQVDVAIEPRARTVALGESLPAGFLVIVQAAGEGEPISDVPLRVEVNGPLVDGRRDSVELQVRTEPDGTAQIPVATPALAGTTQIAVEPAWLADRIDSWKAAVDSTELQDLLSSISERLRARAAVQVTSRAATIPTAMIVLDRDIAGNPIASADTMRGMAQEFMDTDFRIRQVELAGPSRRRLAEAESISVTDLYDILPFDVLSRTERVIVGHAHILEFSEEDGFTVVVEVEAAAFDLRRDEVLARVSFRERISGSDARSAIRTAFQAAGRRLVRRIVPRLP